MVNKANKTVYLNMRVAPAVKSAAEKGAKLARRSLTAYIETLILNAVPRKRRGR